MLFTFTAKILSISFPPWKAVEGAGVSGLSLPAVSFFVTSTIIPGKVFIPSRGEIFISLRATIPAAPGAPPQWKFYCESALPSLVNLTTVYRRYSTERPAPRETIEFAIASLKKFASSCNLRGKGLRSYALEAPLKSFLLYPSVYNSRKKIPRYPISLTTYRSTVTEGIRDLNPDFQRLAERSLAIVSSPLPPIP